jgi:acetylornithine deacetylase/succinyl-diaminopimelate desuccinylase-like protein
VDVIALLEELIRIDSINPFECRAGQGPDGAAWTLAGNETAIAAFLEAQLREAGFAVERQLVHRDAAGTPFENLLAVKGKGPRALLFYGHMDTVTARPWLSREEALTPRREMKVVRGVEREAVVGLGANDMKAGLAVLLAALRDVRPVGYALKVAFGVDEEYYSLGAHVLARSDFCDDVAAVVVPETGDGPNRWHGPSTLGLGRMGRCEFVIDVPGTGGHGAQAYNPDFVNAAAECARVVERIERLRADWRDEFTFAPDPVPDPAAASSIAGSFYVSRVEAGDGTISIPAAGRVIVSFTHSPNVRQEDGLNLLAEMVGTMYQDGALRPVTISGREHRARVSLRPRPTPAAPAYATPADHPFVRFARDVVDGTVGFQNYNFGDSVADENVFALHRPGLPILDISPIGEDCHKAGEWVDAASVRRLVEVYRALALRFQDYRG